MAARKRGGREVATEVIHYDTVGGGSEKERGQRGSDWSSPL